jgi:hypothetical protein
LPTCLDILEQATLTNNKNHVYIDLIKVVSELTPARCIREGTQVVSLKHNDRKRLENLLTEAIKFVNLTSNASHRMNDFQVADAVITIISEYWFLKIEEVIKAFNNGRTEKYGEIYRIDLGTLCSWIDTYINQERGGAIEEIQTRPDPPKRELISDEQAKEFREQFDKLMLQVQSKKEKKIVFDENYWKESFQNNLPMLTDDELKDWQKNLKKDEKMNDLLELLEYEIEYRRNKK